MKCPGQDTQYWTSGAIFEANCPQCNAVVEFYKDDTSRKCSKCGHRFVNPKMDFGCAAYCQFAEQCLGNLPEEFVSQRDNLFKDRVAIEMKRYFNSDFRNISHAMRVARHAEEIGKAEGANLAVILCAAYLQNIGYTEAVKKYGLGYEEYLESESVPVAKEILNKLGANEKLSSAVCSIISHYRHPGDEESTEFNVVYDSVLIADWEKKFKEGSFSKQQAEENINSRIRTNSGRKTAQETFEKIGAS